MGVLEGGKGFPRAGEMGLCLTQIGFAGREPGLGGGQGGLEFEDQPLALRESALESFDANGPPAELFHALSLDGQRLLDLALDPALLHGEFGAQVVLLRRQLRD